MPQITGLDSSPDVLLGTANNIVIKFLLPTLKESGAEMSYKFKDLIVTLVPRHRDGSDCDATSSNELGDGERAFALEI
jgi:hypothetical protein